MLVAKRKDGTLFSLLDKREKSELLAIRRDETFYCPGCGASLQLRLGKKVSWHFAHHKESDCLIHAEAESAYHLQGKKQLYQWLVRQHVPVKLEPYFKQLKQRPDLLLHTHPKTTALEFQCATIDPDLLIKRTKTFQKAGMMPIWILGGNRLKRTGSTTFQLSQMEWLTLRRASRKKHSVFLLYFCPEAQQFAVLTDIVPQSSSKVFARLKYVPIPSFSYLDMYRISDACDFKIPEQWLEMKKQWRLNAFRMNTQPHRFVQRLYGNLSIFPPAAGWPIPHGYTIETPCFLWQSWLFDRFYRKWPMDQPIVLENVGNAFRTLVRENIFQIRELPFLENENETTAIFEYLQCLTALGFLRQENTVFYKKNEISVPQSPDEILRLDAKYFEKLKRIF